MGIAERKTRQKQALRGRILDAARRIVIDEGFAALSMRKIADAIEYSPATLYLHFASRDEIARALCAEGYAQLLECFASLAQIADPAERLRAFAHAYVGFGVAHPQTYRLIFMEDPTYTGAALAPPPSGGVSDDGSAQHDVSGDAAMRLLTEALDALTAQRRLPALPSAVLAEALWATVHGIVALNLTCPVFPSAPLESVVDAALDAWVGPRGATGATSVDAAAPARPRARRAAKQKVAAA